MNLLELNPRYIDPPNFGEWATEEVRIIELHTGTYQDAVIQTAYEGLNIKNMVTSDHVMSLINSLLSIRPFRRVDFTDCVIPNDSFKQLTNLLDHHMEILSLQDNTISVNEMEALFGFLNEHPFTETGFPLKTLIIKQPQIPNTLNWGILNQLKNLEIDSVSGVFSLAIILENLQENRSVERLIIRNTLFNENTIRSLVSLIIMNDTITEYVFENIQMDQENAFLITNALVSNKRIQSLTISHFIDDILPVLSLPA